MTAMTTIVYPVKDLNQAKSIYRALLGVEPYADTPYYVGYRLGEQEVGLDPNGHQQSLTGPVVYVNVTNIHERLKNLLDAGTTLVQDVRDVGGGKLIATLKDASGNDLGLMQTP